MACDQFYNELSRKTIVTGHYGSGKTEFTVSLAMLLSRAMMLSKAMTQKIAIVDLDIVNPYFRSREQRELLKEAGISIYGSAFDFEVTAELPALGATVRTPLEDTNCKVLVDVGGNDSGALVLNQFSKYLTDDATILAIINANRPDTSEIDGALEHITAIERVTNLTISGIVNNTHLLRETTLEDIKKGHSFCTEICNITGKNLFCNCYPNGIIDPDDLTEITGNLMPLGLYMRPTWLDKK